MGQARDPLEQALGAITELDAEDFATTVDFARRTGRSVTSVLMDRGQVSQADVVEAMSRIRQEYNATRLTDLPPWDSVLAEVEPVPPGERDALIIMSSKDKRKRAFLLLAIDHSNPQQRQGEIARLTAKIIRTGRVFGGRITATRAFIRTVVDQQWARQERIEPEESLSDPQRDFDRIGLDAFKRGASDIHMTVLDGRGTIAYRIDGDLEYIEDRPASYIEAIVGAAYNTLSEDGSTKGDFNAREYQDASIERHYDVGLIRFRYSAVPLAPSGFDITLRIIPIGVDQGKRDVAGLGYSPDQLDKLRRAFSNSAGMMLWLGTTGSGKSTSMAAVLEQLAEEYPGKKVRTVEEPVEARIRGAFQTPVIKKKDDGSDFKNVLRQLMRSDPDVIMIGEIRDDATADIAIQAVRTGHLCLSTLHCQGAPGAFDRLIGMGVGRADVASVGLFLGFIFQVLVQKLCRHCKVPAQTWAKRQPDHAILARLHRLYGGDLEGIYFESPEGCPECNHKGRSGRTACAEILTPTPEISQAVLDGNSAEVWRLWRSQINKDDPADMSGRTAFEHALYKMRTGVISPFAVERAFKYVDEPPYPGGKVGE